MAPEFPAQLWPVICLDCNASSVFEHAAQVIFRQRDEKIRALHSFQGGKDMGIISWVVMGLIVGVLAKWIMPGDDPGGFVITILLGIGGAFVGGFVGSLLGLGSVTGFNLMSLALAVGGALVLLYGYRLLNSK